MAGGRDNPLAQAAVVRPVLIIYPRQAVVEFTNNIDVLRQIGNKWDHCAAENQHAINSPHEKEVSHVENQ